MQLCAEVLSHAHQQTDRVWLRDSGPHGVHAPDGSVSLVHWGFNAWSKYDNYALDQLVPEAVERVTGLPRIVAKRPDNGERLILEGGGIETDGLGTMLVTEEWLLSDGGGNPALDPRYERAFSEYLGIKHRSGWGEGCVVTTPRKYRRYRALRGPVRCSYGARGRPGRRESCTLAGQPATGCGWRKTRAETLWRIGHVAVSARRGMDGVSPACELRKLLHRERHRDRAHVQWTPTTAWRSTRSRSFSRRISSLAYTRGTRVGVGTLHLPHAAAARGATDRYPHDDSAATDARRAVSGAAGQQRAWRRLGVCRNAGATIAAVARGLRERVSCRKTGSRCSRPRWETTYRQKIAPFLDDPALCPRGMDTLPSLVRSGFLYRKLYIAFAAFVIVRRWRFRADGFGGSGHGFVDAGSGKPLDARHVDSGETSRP